MPNDGHPLAGDGLRATKPFSAADSGREYHESMEAWPMEASAGFQLQTSPAAVRIGRPSSTAPSKISGRDRWSIVQAIPPPPAEFTTRVHRTPTFTVPTTTS